MLGPLLLALIGIQSPSQAEAPELEPRRVLLEQEYQEGQSPPSFALAVELGRDLAQASNVPEWLRVEVSAVVQDYARLEALDAQEQERLLGLLAERPDPAQGAEAALTALQGLADQLEEDLGPNHPAVLERYAYLSNLSRQLGRLEASEAFAREGLDRVLAMTPPRVARVIGHQSALGFVLLQIGKFDEAQVLLEQAWAQSQELGLADWNAFVASRLSLANHLGQLHLHRRETEQAEAYLHSYLELAEATEPPGSQTRLSALSNLAEVLKQQGRPEAAWALRAESLASASREPVPPASYLFQLYFNYAGSCLATGRRAEAREALLRCLDLGREHDLDRYVMCLAQSMLGILAMAEGQQERGLELALGALRDAESVKDFPLSGRIGLARSHMEALVRNQRTVEARRELPAFQLLAGESAPRAVQCLEGAILLQEGKLDEALDCFQQVLGVDEAEFGVQDEWTRMALGRIAEVHFRREEFDRARSVLNRGSRHLERARAAFAFGFTRSELNDDPGPMRVQVELLDGQEEEAFVRLEAWTSRTLAELMTAAGDETRRSLERQLTDLDDQIRVLAKQEHRSESSDRTAELERDTLQIRLQLSQLKEAVPPTSPALEDLQQGLARDEAYVGWFEAPWDMGPQAWAWVLRHSGSPRFVPLDMDSDAPPLAAQLQGYSRFLGLEARSPFLSGEKEARTAARDLGKLLFGTLLDARALEGIRHLSVVSRGIEGIPLESLWLEGDWLNERWTVAYVPSCGLGHRLRQGSSKFQGQRKALALGDPPFRPNHVEGAGTKAPIRGASPAFALATARRLDQLERMPATRAEAQAVAQRFPGSRLLLGEEATEANLRELAQSDALVEFHVLHLASHALVDGRDSRRTGLVLSQVDLPDPYRSALRDEPVRDGFLRVPEILANWRLDAELVTLSACGSALGQPVRGEGYVGLVTAFLRVGARSVLASQWDVQDEATLLLMDSFYGHWSRDEGPRAKARALQNARRELRDFEQDGQRPYAHPGIWSAFVLVGSPD